MEREKFERSWKEAFEKAEANPSDQVWTNIELELERERGGELKRRLFFYKMLAAASVVFALTVGVVGYYQMTGLQQAPQLAEETKGLPAGEPLTIPLPANEEDTRVAEAGPAANAQESTRLAEEGRQDRRIPQQAAVREVRPPTVADSRREQVALGSPNEVVLPRDLPGALDEDRLPPLYSANRRFDAPLLRQDDPASNEVDPVVAMLARLEQREMELRAEPEREREENTADHEQLWTSVGFAAGAFNTVHASTSNIRTLSGQANSVAAPIVDQEAKASGMSYSMGINLGTRIGERWVLQGGVNYLTHASEYTADNIIKSSGYASRFMAVSSNALMKESDLNQKIVYSAPYTVNNNMSYLSIPMQAGYLLIDKEFGLQLNAGVATDLFLQNTVKGESDQLAKNSQPAGEDSPYRAVNLSGLVGTELSYRFGDHYRISLNPGVRYPFNTIYKSELGIQSTPITFDVGLRFRYIFH